MCFLAIMEDKFTRCSPRKNIIFFTFLGNKSGVFVLWVFVLLVFEVVLKSACCLVIRALGIRDAGSEFKAKMPFQF